MANTIQLKRSAVQGNVPTTAQLALGEIGINTYDGKVFIKKDDGVAAIVEVGGASNLDGLSDVVITTPAEGQILLHDGTGWINSPALGVREVFIATAAQTVFTTSNAYVVGSGQLSIYINGIKQYPATYTETSTTSFTLSSPAVVNDQVMAEISVLTSAYVQPPAVVALDDLTDVTITTPTAGHLVTYNGVDWVNDTVSSITSAVLGSSVETFTDSIYLTVSNLSGGYVNVNQTTLGYSSAGGYDGNRPLTAIGVSAAHNAFAAYPVTDVTYWGVGVEYRIITIGTTDYTLLGAVSNTIGEVFTSNGTTPTGTGTVLRTGVGDNTAIGTMAMAATMYGNRNVCVGDKAFNIASGDDNVSVGWGSLELSLGSGNTCVGFQAGSQLTGNDNVLIGNGAGTQLAATSSGNVIIGGHSGTSGITNNIILADGIGNIRLQHDGTNWTSTTPISATGLILPGAASTVVLDGLEGTAGQVLTSAGAGATPTWATPIVTSDLDALTDVIITDPLGKDQLMYNGTSWVNSRPVMFENDITITTDYTITTGKNAMSAGPVTIANGITVTVPDGSTWSIV